MLAAFATNAASCSRGCDTTITAPSPVVIPTRRRRIPNAATFAALTIGFAALAWLRLPGLVRGTLWAEDGRDFLRDAMDHGLGQLFAPYGGYLHVVPRLIASATVQFFPVEHYAVAMTAGSCAVAGFCGAIVWFVSRDRLGAGWAILLGSVTVLAPLGAREVLGNTANLHTLLLWTMFWVLLYVPRRTLTAIALGVFALLAALTEVQTVFLLPLMLWRFRERRRWIIYAGLLLGIAGQVVALGVSPRKQTGFGHVDLLSYPFGFLINAVMPLALPQAWIAPIIASTGALVGTVIAVIIALVVFRRVRHASVDVRFVVVAALTLAVLGYCASVYLTPEDYYNYANMSPAQLLTPWYTRYGVLPSMLILGAVIVAAGSRARAARPLSRWIAVAIIASFVMHFTPLDTRRDAAPAWSPQVAAARTTCAAGAHSVLLDEEMGWTVRVPCRLLTAR